MKSRANNEEEMEPEEEGEEGNEDESTESPQKKETQENKVRTLFYTMFAIVILTNIISFVACIPFYE